jgi:hypothetical protein
MTAAGLVIKSPDGYCLLAAVEIFAMRSMASGAAFHRAYLHATQQAFLEAHEHAFACFGGFFLLLRSDYAYSRGEWAEPHTIFSEAPWPLGFAGFRAAVLTPSARHQFSDASYRGV